MATKAVKVNGYSRVKINKRLNQRRKEADIRQSKYEDLPLMAKIAVVRGRGGKRELARLIGQLPKNQPAPVIEASVVETVNEKLTEAKVVKPKRAAKKKA